MSAPVATDSRPSGSYSETIIAERHGTGIRFRISDCKPVSDRFAVGMTGNTLSHYPPRQISPFAYGSEFSLTPFPRLAL
jgi:hypothetical protein